MYTFDLLYFYSVSAMQEENFEVIFFIHIKLKVKKILQV